jgi:hypothetical protein
MYVGDLITGNLGVEEQWVQWGIQNLITKKMTGLC